MTQFDTLSIDQIIKQGLNEETNPQILGVIYSLGRDAENDEEYDYAVHMLLSIFEKGTAWIRANCILAFGMMAIYHRKLDEEIIRPLIEQEAATATGNNLSMIQDAVKDINFAMGWGIEAE